MGASANVRLFRPNVAALLIGMTAWLLVPGIAEAADKYDVQVLTIRATNDNSDIDAELKGIADQLKKQTNCSGFKLVKKSAGETKEKRAFSADLVGSYKAKVTPLGDKDKRIELQVSISRKKDDKEKTLVDTKVTLDSGKSQLWAFDRYPGGKNDKLIIAISAK